MDQRMSRNAPRVDPDYGQKPSHTTIPAMRQVRAKSADNFLRVRMNAITAKGASHGFLSECCSAWPESPWDVDKQVGHDMGIALGLDVQNSG
jgi:hypothetical protein